MTTPETKASERLLPCPFCGDTEPSLERNHPKGNFLHVHCLTCGAMSVGSNIDGVAIAAWNTRHPAPGVMEEDEAVAQLTISDISFPMPTAQSLKAVLALTKTLAKNTPPLNGGIRQSEGAFALSERDSTSRESLPNSCERCETIKTDNTQTLYNCLARIKEMETDIMKAKEALETAKRFYAKKSRPPTPAYLVEALAALEKYGEK